MILEPYQVSKCVKDTTALDVFQYFNLMQVLLLKSSSYSRETSE